MKFTVRWANVRVSREYLMLVKPEKFWSPLMLFSCSLQVFLWVEHFCVQWTPCDHDAQESKVSDFNKNKNKFGVLPRRKTVLQTADGYFPASQRFLAALSSRAVSPALRPALIKTCHSCRHYQRPSVYIPNYQSNVRHLSSSVEQPHLLAQLLFKMGKFWYPEKNLHE